VFVAIAEAVERRLSWWQRWLFAVTVVRRPDWAPRTTTLGAAAGGNGTQLVAQGWQGIPPGDPATELSLAVA